MGSSKGGKPATQTSEPWKAAQPYLLGDSTHTGILPEAMNLYGSGGWTSGMQNLTNNQSSALNDRSAQSGDYYSLSNIAKNGGFDPNVNHVSGISGASQINAGMVDPTKAFSSMGSLDPTGSMSRMLSGNIDTSTLDPVVNTALGRLSDNFRESVMPSIASGAIASGQYGGSRQGIAEGLAAKSLANSMGDVTANMYNNAYNTAQGNMYGAASNMANLGLNTSTNNANRDFSSQTTNASNQLGMQQFNANLGLQNNSQAMQSALQNLQNRQTGLGVMQQGNNLTDNIYSQQLELLGAPNSTNWTNLNNYANIVMRGSGMGGSSASTQPYSSNTGSRVLGGALGGAGIATALGLSNPWTAGLAIGGGLLGVL